LKIKLICRPLIPILLPEVDDEQLMFEGNIHDYMTVEETKSVILPRDMGGL